MFLTPLKDISLSLVQSLGIFLFCLILVRAIRYYLRLLARARRFGSPRFPIPNYLSNDLGFRLKMENTRTGRLKARLHTRGPPYEPRRNGLYK